MESQGYTQWVSITTANQSTEDPCIKGLELFSGEFYKSSNKNDETNLNELEGAEIPGGGSYKIEMCSCESFSEGPQDVFEIRIVVGNELVRDVSWNCPRGFMPTVVCNGRVGSYAGRAGLYRGAFQGAGKVGSSLVRSGYHGGMGQGLTSGSDLYSGNMQITNSGCPSYASKETEHNEMNDVSKAYGCSTRLDFQPCLHTGWSNSP